MYCTMLYCTVPELNNDTNLLAPSSFIYRNVFSEDVHRKCSIITLPFNPPPSCSFFTKVFYKFCGLCPPYRGRK